MSKSRSNTPERKNSPYCSHKKSDIQSNRTVYKTKKQIQEEENHRFLLSTRIKCNFSNFRVVKKIDIFYQLIKLIILFFFQDLRQYISSLKDREYDLIEKNKNIIEFIDRTEKSANENVDIILRKYEKYQVINKINKYN